MKKIFLLVVVISSLSSQLFAASISEQDVNGKWKCVNKNSSQVEGEFDINLNKGMITVTIGSSPIYYINLKTTQKPVGLLITNNSSDEYKHTEILIEAVTAKQMTIMKDGGKFNCSR